MNNKNEKKNIWKVIALTLFFITIVLCIISNINYKKLSQYNEKLYEENNELRFQNDRLSQDIKTAKYKVGDIVKVEFGGVITAERQELCKIVGVKRKGCSIYYDVSSLEKDGYGPEIEEDRIVPGKYKEVEINIKSKKYELIK
jgi:predicted RND superfamily exporter protein